MAKEPRPAAHQPARFTSLMQSLHYPGDSPRAPMDQRGLGKRTGRRDVARVCGNGWEGQSLGRLVNSATLRFSGYRNERAEFRAQYGTDYRTGLDFVFANPNAARCGPTPFPRPFPC